MSQGIFLPGPNGAAVAKERDIEHKQAQMIHAMIAQQAAQNMAQMLGAHYNTEVQKATAKAADQPQSEQPAEVKLSMDLDLMADVAIEASRTLLFRLGIIGEKAS